MDKDIKEYRFDFLKIFYEAMEKEGVNHKIYRTDIDNDFVTMLNSKIKDSLTLEESQQLADICLANDWIEHTVMGGKYIKLSLTTTGLGVVKSKLTKIESLEKRSFFKKISDFVNDHSGILVLLSFAVSLSSLIVAVIAIILGTKQGK